MIAQAKLKSAVESAWAADTAYQAAEWSPGNPARGQCVATALVVQYYLGGDLERLITVYNGKAETHYRNVLPNGDILDWTRRQYPAAQMLRPKAVDLKGFASIRDKRLSDPVTKHRYELLLGRVKQHLAQAV